MVQSVGGTSASTEVAPTSSSSFDANRDPGTASGSSETSTSGTAEDDNRGSDVSSGSFSEDYEGADEADVPSTFPGGYALCTRRASENGVSTLDIIGPVGEGPVDATAFTHVVSVRAPRDMSCREVYARACTRLVECGMYASLAATYHSVRVAARNINVGADEEGGGDEPSWCGVDPLRMSMMDAHKVVTRAVRHMRTAGRNATDGSVTIHDVQWARHHPWRLHALRARDRRVARHAVRFYRRRVTQIIRQDARVVSAIGAGACSRLRHALELYKPSATTRARRVQVSHGQSMPRILPARDAYTALKRHSVDSDGSIPHRLWTLAATGEVRTFHYVRGSATTGQRMYQGADCRQWRLSSSGTKRALHGYSKSPHETTTGEACAQVTVGDDVDLLADMRGASTSFLVSAEDNAHRIKVVALEFDGKSLVQRAIDDGLDPTYVVDPRSASNVITVAADGGPVCRRTLTVVTLTLSAEYLVERQSPLMPMVFILSGEGALHSGVGRHMRIVIRSVLQSQYTVTWNREACTSSGGDQSAVPAREVLLVRPSPILRLLGDFCMLHHLLGLTGGSDKLRCPSGWPCKNFMNPSHPSWKTVQERTINMVELHWEQAIWSLSRWCALSPRGWDVVNGVVGSTCRGCKCVMPYETSDVPFMSCRQEGCPREGQPQTLALPVLPKTVMGDALRAARRIFGGVRGPPAVPNVPVVAQDPVLHCTSDVVKKLVYLHLALLSRSEADKTRLAIHELEGKTNMASLYGREFRSLVAKILARPAVLGVPIDSALLQMFALAQVLCASWRVSVGRGTQAERERAAAVLELAAKLLAPLFATLKPLDPETKSRGAQNLYLHTAAAHSRARVGRNAPAVPLVSDDDIEGVIRHLNSYFKSRTSNVSRVEALTDMHSVSSYVSAPQRLRFVAESCLYTSTIRVCSCYASLAPPLAGDLATAVALAEADDALSVSRTTRDDGGYLLTFRLPTAGRETHQSILSKAAATDAGDIESLGMERRIALALLQTQRTVTVCFCGVLGCEVSHLATEKLPAMTPAAAAVPEDEAAEVVAEGESDTVAEDVPVVTTEADFLCDSDPSPSIVSSYVPSARVRQLVLQDMDARVAFTSEMVAEVRAELTMLDMFIKRTRTSDFATWCDNNSTQALAVREAAESVRAKLLAITSRSPAAVMRVV